MEDSVKTSKRGVTRTALPKTDAKGKVEVDASDDFAYVDPDVARAMNGESVAFTSEITE